jgi:hypothetical protein
VYLAGISPPSLKAALVMVSIGTDPPGADPAGCAQAAGTAQSSRTDAALGVALLRIHQS